MQRIRYSARRANVRRIGPNALDIASSVALAITLAILAVACGAHPTPSTWPGSTSRLPVSEENRPKAGADSARSHPDSALPGLPRVPKASQERLIEPRVLAALVAATDHPQESQGHEPPNTLVQVFVSAEALDAYLAWGPGSTLPKGTWLVARHAGRTNGEGAGLNSTALAPIYTMYRGPNGWLYGAANAKGLKITVVDRVCHDCHTQARSDSVFGPPWVVVPIGSKTTPGQ